MELLLLSNSTLPGKAWLEHALPLIAEQLQGRRSAVFIPFAGVTQTWDDYTEKTAAVLAPLGVSVTGIHSVVDPVAAIENAEIVIVGGGNTFQLLKQCRERGLLAPITDVVKRGALYIGWSAGANLACPTIRTTNDMPIVDPQGFDALNLFPLQINPHFTNALPEGHKGETREQRIRELLVVAPELTIIGLPEGNWITVSKGHATLGGPNTTYVFKAGEEAVPLEAGHGINTRPVLHLHPAVPAHCKPPNKTASSVAAYLPVSLNVANWFQYSARFADAGDRRGRGNSGD